MLVLYERTFQHDPQPQLQFPQPHPLRQWPRQGTGRTSARPHGIKRPLFVTDKGLAATGMVADIMADLKKAGLRREMFSDVRPNPVEENVLDGCKAYVTAASMTASSPSAAARASTPPR
jgi:hypothetical protein